MVYLENINLPQVGAPGVDNRYSAGSNLLINAGIWQGFLIALELPVIQIPPQTWQAAHGLFRWQSLLRKDPSAETPFTLARRLWPDAPLEFQADEWNRR
jgi:hypothetical protein